MSTAKMDREPLSAPFSVGQRVRYIGDRNSSTEVEGKLVPLLGKGMEFDIVETSPGRRGTGRLLFIDDDGHEVRDRTEDGTSTYVQAGGAGRLIRPEYANEWEVVR